MLKTLLTMTRMGVYNAPINTLPPIYGRKHGDSGRINCKPFPGRASGTHLAYN